MRLQLLFVGVRQRERRIYAKPADEDAVDSRQRKAVRQRRIRSILEADQARPRATQWSDLLLPQDARQ